MIVKPEDARLRGACGTPSLYRTNETVGTSKTVRSDGDILESRHFSPVFPQLRIDEGRPGSREERSHCDPGFAFMKSGVGY